MAARLFRLGRILCTPPRLIAANCSACVWAIPFRQWCAVALLRCDLLAVFVTTWVFPGYIQETSALAWEGGGKNCVDELSFLVLDLSVRLITVLPPLSLPPYSA